MTQIEKVNKLKTLISMIIIIILVSCYFNDFHLYPIKESDLEASLLQQVKAEGIEGKILMEKDILQGRAYIVLGGDKKTISCVTYVKSLYSNRWRQDLFDSIMKENGKTKIKTLNNYFNASTEENPYQFQYDLTTQLLEYSIIWSVDLEKVELSEIILEEEAKPVLMTKTFVIGIILASWFAGRIIGFAQQRKKKY